MSLAIAEKRPQKLPGGCVGLFFHHLFSKKKLFSTKLLTPVKRAAAAKKFAGDDKVPMGKLLLINDESHGGYSKPEPDPKTSAGSRLQVPGIVARLMGLESMPLPLPPHEKHKKAMDLDLCNDGDSEHSRLYHGSDNAVDRKAESRPPKLQKTERFLEKAEGDAFHNGLITGFRKKQQVRLEPPAKSPRVLSRSNTARLIQVANKILEPGLHSRSRARPAIMYRSSLEGDGDGGEEPLSDSLVGSCSSCGGLVTAKEPLVSEFGCSGFDSGNLSEEGKKFKSAVVPSCKSKSPEDRTKLKSEEGSKLKSVVALTVQAKFNVENGVHNPVGRKQGVGSVEDQLKKSSLKRISLRQNQLPPIRDKGAQGAKVRSRKQTGRDLNEFQNGAKDFLALNKNHSSSAHSRSPTKVSTSRNVEWERNGWEKNTGRKKRPNHRSQIGSVKSVSSTFGKEKSAGSYVNKRKETGPTNSSTAGSCIRTATQKLDGNNVDGSKDSGIISFTFNSPMRCNSRSPTCERMVERRDQDELCQDACHRNKATSDENIGSSSSAKGMALGGVELSNLLEEKIRELSSLDQHELTTGDDLPGRSTASILEELISALTVGVPESQNNDDDNFSDVSIRTDISIAHNQFSNIDREFQGKAQPGIITAYPMNDNQPSPVSILEASFSNDSCSFGSPNGSSGCKPQFGLPEICNKIFPLDPEADLVDTATSLNNCQPDDEKMCHSIHNSSSIYEVPVSETESSKATGAISDAELFFESIFLTWSEGSAESFDSFLLDTLETITDVFLLKFNAKEENQLRWLLYDCLMESLNSKCSLFCKSSYISWMKLPLILGKEQLMQEVHAEINGWWDLAGIFFDGRGPLEKEISMSNIKWTERKAETFDLGVDIQHDILQTLIHEMLIDLCCY